MVKTMTITEEAYERLASRKSPGESFSWVIMKLTGRATLLDLVGVLTREEASSIRSAIRNRRTSIREGMEGRRRIK